MTRRRILVACARDLLTEAYYIEKLGLGFTAKMALLSETTEERMLYCLFAGDEAAHLHAIAAYVGDGAAASAPDDPFLALLTEAIAAGDKPGLTYVVQVVLEGWGIAHYQSIARDCRDGDLRRTLLRLARDEALHHGSGVALLKRRPLPAAGPDLRHGGSRPTPRAGADRAAARGGPPGGAHRTSVAGPAGPGLP